MPNPKLQQGIVNIQNQDTQTTPVVKPGRSQYSSENPYQQNLQKPAQPEKWYAGDQPTSREMLGKIYSIYQEDKDYGQKLLNNFHMEQQNPASAYYNAYSQTTNKAVQNLASYGIDASQINDAWYAANPGWDSYLSFNGTTNTPSKPGKKASIQEKIAYEIYQYGKADADTKAAKTEWDAMRQELMYWAARTDLNMSDDEIIDKVNREMKSKYPTLYRMQESLSPGGALLELNEASEFSLDNMYGAIWAGRNDGGTGSSEANVMMSAAGEGTVWKDNPEIAAKKDWNNKATYSRYAVGMTLDEAGLYFGVRYFNDAVLDEIRKGLDENDQTAVKYYNDAVKANDTTKKAEEELKNLTDKVNGWLQSGKSEGFILKQVDKLLQQSGYSTLRAMDESLANGSKLLDTTRAIDYRKQDFIQKIKDCFADSGNKTTAADLAANGVNQPEESAASVRTIRELDEYTRDATAVFEDDATPEESAAFSGYSGSHDAAKNALTTVRLNKDSLGGMDQILSKQTDSVIGGYIQETTAVYKSINDYEDAQKRLDEATMTAEALRKELGAKEFYGQKNSLTYNTEINGVTYRVTMDPSFDYINSIDEYVHVPGREEETYPVYDDGTESSGIWKTIRESDEFAAKREEYKQKAEKIKEAEGLEITEQDEKLLQALRQADMQIEDAEKYLRSNKDQYEKDVASYQSQMQRLEAHRQNLIDAGKDTYDVDVAMAVMKELSNFTDYEATVWESYNPTYAYTEAIANGEDKAEVMKQAEADYREAQECIKDIEWEKKYIADHHIQIPDNVRQNMERRLAKHKRDIQDYEFFKTQWASDFDAVVAEQRRKEYDARNRKSLLGISTPFDGMSEEEYFASMENGQYAPEDYGANTLAGMTEGMSSLMTQEERDTYYYLKAKDELNGTKKANDYINFMMDPTYGVLWTRQRMKTEEDAANLTSSGAGGFIAANAAAVLLSPYNAISSGAMWAYNKLTGSELNPNSPFLTFSHFRNKTREQSAEEILKTFGEKDENGNYKETTLSKIAQGGYEILTNRLDSAMNAGTFGWMFSGIENEMLKELLGAAPMGASAAMEAAARAKERGATDAQAYAIATYTFFAETGTEAISLDNMKSALKIGEEMTADTFKKFALKWLTQAGISEAFGESLNDIIENYADEKIMGQLSEHAETVEKYRSEGYGPEDAEAMARRDEINGVLRTALISYLSPGLDVFQTVKGRYNYYKGKTIEWNDAHPNDKKTFREIRDGIRQEQKETREADRKQQEEWKSRPVEEMGDIDFDTLGQKTGYNLTADEQRKEQIAMKKQQAESYAVDFEILETAKDGDQSAQKASISAILDVDNTAESKDASDAAAGMLIDVLGERNAATEVQDLMTGANVTNANIPQETIKQGIMYAALGGEESACRQTMLSDAYQKATPAVKASMLAQAVQEDQQNQKVNDAMPQVVHNYRVAVEEARLISEGATKTIEDTEAKAIEAEGVTFEAQKKLDEQRAAEKAAFEAVRQAGLYSDANTHQAKLGEAMKQVEKRKAYEAELAAAQRREQAAKEKARKASQQVKAQIRQQAEANIAQQDQQRQQEAEQQRIAQEQEAVRQEQENAARESNENALNADIDALIDQEFPNATEEQKAHVREMAKQAYDAMQKEAAAAAGEGITVDELLNRKKVLDRLGKRYNFKVDVRETTEGGKTFFSEGYFDRETNTLVLDTSTTLQQAMYKILGHELTHIAEQSQTYGELANALLQDAYGKDVTFDGILKQMEAGDFSSQLAQDILEKKKTYDDTLKKDHSYKYMLEEVVADRMGDILNGDQELINRLAKEEPGVIRRIIDAIKSFLKGNKNVKGEWQTESQRIVDMLENALKDAQSKQEGNDNRRFHLTTPIEQLDSGLIATHSVTFDDFRKMMKLEGMPALSIAIGANNGYLNSGFFGEISLVFDKSSIDPQANPENYVFGRDSWTPTFPHTKKGLLGERFVENKAKVTATNAVELMKQQNLKSGIYGNAFMDTETPDINNNKGLVRHLIAEFSKNYNSIEEIQADRDRLGTKGTSDIQAELVPMAQELDQLKGEILDEMKAAGRDPAQLYDNVSEGQARELIAAFGYVAGDTNNVGFAHEIGLSDETIAKMRDLISRLQNSTAAYAEAKPMRVQSWDEIKVAAIPKNTPLDIYDFLKGIGADIEFYKEGDNADRGRVLNESETVRNRRFSLPTENVIAADDNGQPLATELPGGTVAINTDNRYSLSSLNGKERDKIRQALYNAKDEKGNKRFTKTEVDKYLYDAMGIAAKIAQDRHRLDFEASDVHTMLKPNNEYKYTVDASTLCAKRLLYQGTFDAIQHLLPNTPLLPEDLIDLSNLMREMGYETPCGICYVESRRRHLDKFASEWLEKYKGDYKPTLAEVTSTDGLEALRTSKQKSQRKAYQDFVDAMNHKGVANPKVVQLRTEYRGEIRDLRPMTVKSLINHGGLRLQSFSDFETPHLLDMMQVVMDMAAKNLTSQAYTKVPNFAWVFGDTGVKINLSEIGKGTGIEISNGLSFDEIASMPYEEASKLIRLLYDDVEGMPHDQAVALRNRYSKNVGTILVGINDAHIIAAMGDSEVDFIIPFHKSGWSENELARMPVLNGYDDYTDSQNEKKIKGKKAGGGYEVYSADDYKLKNFEPVGQKNANGKGQNGYWDFTKSGRENAETYLKMCKDDGRMPKFSQFLVDDGDGGFSLPQGDDYRSTAIREGYWKTLIDFKMYDNEGNGSPQMPVTPNVNMAQANRVLKEYSLDRNGISRKNNNDLPVAQPVVDRYVEEYKAKHPLDENRTRYSLPNAAVMDQSYEDAYNAYDEDAGEQLVAQAAEAAMPDSKIRDDDGKLKVVYHQTNADPFTEFDVEKARTSMDVQGLFFAPEYDEYHEYGDRTYAVYLDIKNPAYNPQGPDLSKTDDGRRMRQELMAQGYDGIINMDENGKPYEYVAFSPEQVKSAEAFTEDDDGNLIALSERFNPYSRDIRYALPSDKYLEQKIRRYLVNGGSAASGEQQGPQRQFGSKTAQRSDVLSDVTLQYLKDNSSYIPDTNEAELTRAIQWITKNQSEGDADGYQKSLQRVTSKSFNYRTKDGQARTIAVMGMAAAKNDINAQIQLADAYNKEGTDIAQALQARKLFRLMTPEGRIAAMRKMLSDAQDNVNRKGKNIELEFSNWIYQAAANATEEGDFEKVRNAAIHELAEQIPANWKDRVRSLRMLSMLANPRTHIRNIIGNAMFIPAVSLKNKLGAIGEIVSGQERTKTLALTVSSEIRNFAREDANNIKDILTGEAKFSEATQIVKAQNKLGKAMDWLSEKNSNALEKEDWLFLKGHYRRALGGWMQANGYTVEQVKNDKALLEKGRAYAVQEAQKATYRDFNKTASMLNKVSQNGGIPGFIVDAVLPFKKTPANILRRGLEYSPVGIVKSLTTDMYHMKQWLDYQNGKLNALPEKAMSPTQVIDDICSGLSGTAITALGFLLAGTGAVSCGLDDDDDKLEKAKGGQEYAVKFSLFGQDVTFTMDWAAPMSMPFFVGAAIREQVDNGGEFDADEMLNAFGNITEPVFNLSMLDGINTLFRTSQYDDTNTITQIGAKVLTNYATSYVPSALGAIARTIDDKQRKSFVKQGEGTGIMGTLRYAREQVENKIPGLNQTNIAFRDIWGEEKTSSFAERLLENFILPGYVNNYEEDPIINEMGRLFDVTGDASMIPKEDPAKAITVNKVKHVLEAEEWDRYKEVRNKTAHQELTELLNSAEYNDKRTTDAVRAQMIKDVWSHADKVGQQAVIPDVEVEAKDVAAIAKDSKVTGLKNELIKALNADDYDAYDTMVEAIREEFDDESEADAAIKTKIGNTYRDQWKDAYRKGDDARMTEIEDILDYTGFDFNIYGKNGWQEKVDEKYGE